MNSKTLTLALGAPLLLALAVPGDKVAFAPAEDAAVTKNLRVKAEFRLDDLYMNMMGQEITPEMMGTDTTQPFSMEMIVAVTERYVKSGGGRPLELLRTFDGLSMTGEAAGETEEMDDFAQLEGETVLFKWDEEGSEYVKSFHESEEDEELLGWLDADMDLRLLLPEGEVDADDTWRVPAGKLYPLFVPGGFPSAPTGDDAAEMAGVGEEVMDQLRGAFEDLQVDCTWAGTREVGETSVGVIKVVFDGEVYVNLADVIRTAAEAQGGGPDIEDLVFDVELRLTGEGELLWDMKAGRAHGFTMSSDMDVVVDGEMSMSVEGQAMDATMSAELSGRGDWQLETE